MKRKNVINVLISIIIVAILTFAFVSCDVNNGKEDSLSTTKVVVVPVIEDVTDEAGETVTDAEGEKVTEVVGTTSVVVKDDEEAPTHIQKPEPTKPNKPTTEKETEESTTKAPETTKPKPQPTQPKPTQPKPTEPKPTQPKPTQPSGGGSANEDNWSDEPIHPGGYVQDPNTNDDSADKDFEENGWDDSWQLH